MTREGALLRGAAAIAATRYGEAEVGCCSQVHDGYLLFERRVHTVVDA